MVEYSGAVSRRQRSPAEDVHDRAGRPEEDQHGASVRGGIARRERSCSHPLGDRQEVCVSEIQQFTVVQRSESENVFCSWTQRQTSIKYKLK